jgi:TonB family protein
VGIDKQGRIRSVKVTKKAGHGFDEAAEKALWQFRWSAARAHDGRPVDRQITYKYTFRLPR